MRLLKTKTEEKIFFAPKGYGRDKIYTDSLPKKAPDTEKKVKVPRRRKLSPETILAGELSDKGLSVSEIALKTGEHGYKVKVRIEVWEKYRLIN